MVSYTTVDSSNDTVELSEFFKVNSVDGIDLTGNELFCTGFIPDGFNMRGYNLGWVNPVPIKIQRFSKINPNTLIPEYEPEQIINGEVHKMAEVVNHLHDVGADSPVSDIKIKFLNTNIEQSFSGFNACLRDRLHGQLFPGLYKVRLVIENYTEGDEDLGEPGCLDNTNSISLPYEHIDPNDQYNVDDVARKIGDAKLVLRRDRLNAELTEALENRAENKEAYITICSENGQNVKYTLWEGSGIRRKQTYFMVLMLKREQQND